MCEEGCSDREGEKAYHVDSRVLNESKVSPSEGGGRKWEVTQDSARTPKRIYVQRADGGGNVSLPRG